MRSVSASNRSSSRKGSKWLAGAALLAALAVTPVTRAIPAEEDVTPPPPVVTSVFDGVWEVTVQPDSAAANAGKQTFVDLVLFENGKLTASACAQYGFAPSAFTVSESSFSSSMTSEHGTIAWTATMANGHLAGNVVWSKSDGSVYHYTLAADRYQPVEDQTTTTEE